MQFTANILHVAISISRSHRVGRFLLVCLLGLMATAAHGQQTVGNEGVTLETEWNDTVCQGVDYVAPLPNLPTHLTRDTGTFHFSHFETQNDTTYRYELTLTVLPSYTHDTTIYIIAGDTLDFADTLLAVAGIYRFCFAAENGCDSVVTLHLAYESVCITASDEEVCPGEAVMLTAAGVSKCQWHSMPHDPELAQQQGLNPIVVHPMQPTSYTLDNKSGITVAAVSVDVLTGHGHCNEELAEDNDSTVTYTTDSSSVSFPDVFFPSEKSNNRFVATTSAEVVEFELTVYNKLGMKVWNTTDVAVPWDGTLNGYPMPRGPYVYRWTLEDVHGERCNGIGTVTLAR